MLRLDMASCDTVRFDYQFPVETVCRRQKQHPLRCDSTYPVVPGPSGYVSTAPPNNPADKQINLRNIPLMPLCNTSKYVQQ